jgi:hypothetical protein
MLGATGQQRPCCGEDYPGPHPHSGRVSEREIARNPFNLAQVATETAKASSVGMPC